MQVQSRESSLVQQSLLKQAYLPTTAPRQSFKKFTFNDTDTYRKSTSQLWNQIYQYPSDLGFFKSQKESAKEDQKWESCHVQTARQAWSIYDPEKEPSLEVSVFRANKQQKLNEQIKQNRQQQERPNNIKKGWGDLFSQPFWGSSSSKPPPFMGAFDHVQPDFGNSLNVSIPSSSQYKPYSCYYEPSKIAYESSPYEIPSNYTKILDSKLIDSKQSRQKKQANENKYYFQIESVQSKEKSQIQIQEDFKESRISFKQEPIDRSALWSYNALFGERKPFKHADPAWQTLQNQPIDSLVNSKVFQVYKQGTIQSLYSMEAQVNLPSDIGVVITDEFVLSQISKMLQNVECELFTLDYESLTWKLDLMAFRPQFFLRNSLSSVLEQILTLASHRSRLSAALNFLRNNKYRKVYFELNAQINQFLILFEEIVLELSTKCTLLQFLKQAQGLSKQIKILYSLLINSQYIKQQSKIYQDFDYKFLHSQALIFKRVVKLARTSDSLSLDTNPFTIKLLQAVFKPLFTLLDKLLFEQCQYLQLNSDLYLRYYFTNPKEIVDSVGKKLYLIKQESNQLYLICKVKEKLYLLNNIKDLAKYEKKWEKTFQRKRKLIERIRKQHKLKLKWEEQKKKEAKMKEIYELKNKIYQYQQEEVSRRKSIRDKNLQDLQKLKNELQQRRQKRKLIEQLEKERQKSVLLDIELQEKQKLAKQKQKLMQQMEIEKQLVPSVLVEDKAEKLENQGQPIVIQSQLSIESKSQQQIAEQNEKPKDQMKEEEAVPVSEIIEPIVQEILQIPQKAESQILRPQSEKIIISANSIRAFEQRFTQTADAFHSLQRKKRFEKSRTSSYFRLAQKPQQKLQSKSLSSEELLDQMQRQHSDISEQSIEMQAQSDEEDYLQKERLIDLQTCLSICMDQIVRKQTQIVQNCLRFIIIDKHSIMQIIDFLRKTFMSGDGQKMQQFIHLSIGSDSQISLRHFNKCLLFDTQQEYILNLSPIFYHSKNDARYSEVNIMTDNLENYLGFQFQTLPNILEPYFSYIHLSKYMQIFGFIVRLRHCENLIAQCWKLLNTYKKELDKKQKNGLPVEYQTHFMNRLCRTRYTISNFIKTFENYLFFRVIEKQYKNFRTNLTELNELQENHIKMLDNIIKYGFIDNPNHNISKTFKEILAYIGQFYNIVKMLTLDDIPSYSWEETERKAQFIGKTFQKELRDIEKVLFKAI